MEENMPMYIYLKKLSSRKGSINALIKEKLRDVTDIKPLVIDRRNS